MFKKTYRIMQEDLVTFETAKLAKEKGFNIPTFYFYRNNASLGKNIITFRNNTQLNVWHDSQEKWSAPTQSLLQKWLREVHGIHINIDFGLQWGYQLIPIGWVGERFSENFVDNKNWLSYEKALEKGLQEALKLIPNKP